ncbi:MULTISPECIES: nuclear transport factor 2 family protein [Pseudomonas]|uniref:nuclear transport factor 2 family protein n=1 Tax=Pseudomonas TaxID=286 RepID=UPI00107E94A8|nr:MULTISPECIES: nuclear transport factor 2 family protein [Pseudomonas]TGB15427.1 helix-turn-helix domain-containing protein [Pseudomonas aeruginosa]BBR54610.1 transcriptional regulator [Pseudomonas putida]HCF1421233.1 nuclear transport factor 2 family protein [Pseudomonas aeruginosa]
MDVEAGWSVGLGGDTFRPSPESPATHAVVMNYHRAWRGRDIDALMALLDPGVQYNDFFQGRQIGQAELRDYLLASMPAADDETQVYTDRLRVDGDTALLQYQVTLRGSQGLVSFRACEALRVRDGRVVQVDEHATLVRRSDGPSTTAATRGAVSRLGLSARQLGQLANDLQQYFEQGQPYLNADLDMSQIAMATGYTRNQISFFLNQVLGCSFYQHVNRLRLRFLLGQLENVGDTRRVDELARTAGFRSLSTFYRCFREETGLSPRAYLERQTAR